MKAISRVVSIKGNWQRAEVLREAFLRRGHLR